MPMSETTEIGIRVRTMTTMRIIAGSVIQKSSGYPKSASSSTVSTVLRVSSIPPNSFPESV